MQPVNLSAQREKTVQRPSRFSVMNIFRRDYENYEGVPRINIYFLRLLFSLMFLFLSYDAFTHILSHTGDWKVTDAAAWCMWGGFGIVSFFGILRPLKMLPIILLEIVYKTMWLAVVAYPLWIKNQLAGSPAEYTATVFVFVALPVVFFPWSYFFRTYVLGKKSKTQAARMP